MTFQVIDSQQSYDFSWPNIPQQILTLTISSILDEMCESKSRELASSALDTLGEGEREVNHQRVISVSAITFEIKHTQIKWKDPYTHLIIRM